MFCRWCRKKRDCSNEKKSNSKLSDHKNLLRKKRWVGSWGGGGGGGGNFCMYRNIIYILYRVRSLCPHHKPDISLWVWPLGHDTDRLQSGHFQCHTDATSCTIYSKYNAISPYLIGYFPPLQFSKVPSLVPLHGKMWQIKMCHDRFVL